MYTLKPFKANASSHYALEHPVVLLTELWEAETS